MTKFIINPANENEMLSIEGCRDEIDKLQEEKEQRQERIEYLERSNNRREDTILEQRQEIELLEHYKTLYQSLKKQKDDVVEYLKTTTYSDITGLEKHNITEFWFIKDLLIMLGEIDEN